MVINLVLKELNRTGNRLKILGILYRKSMGFARRVLGGDKVAIWTPH